MTAPPDTIDIRVLFFARTHELAGTARCTLPLPSGSTVRDAGEELERRFPDLGPYLARCRLAVDQEFADASRVLEDGSELAVIPPVSGG